MACGLLLGEACEIIRTFLAGGSSAHLSVGEREREREKERGSTERKEEEDQKKRKEKKQSKNFTSLEYLLRSTFLYWFYLFATCASISIFTTRF